MPLLALAAAAAIPASRDAALAWQLSQPVVVRPAPEADPRLRLGWTQRYLAGASQLRDRSAEIRLAARQVLAANPLDAMAMRQLGAAAEIEREGSGRSEFRLSERISRRDLAGQLVLIELAARDGDLGGALSHYDRALLVHPETHAQLLPVLARALSDSEIRTALGRFTGREWFRNFLLEADRHGADSLSLVTFLAELRGKLPPTEVQPAASRLLARLLSEGSYATARDLLLTMPGVPADAVDAIGFSAATTDPRLAPLNWAIRSDDAVQAGLEGDTLAVNIAPERSAVVAERTTLLAPGRYTLSQRLGLETDAPLARLEWTVTCLAQSRAPLLVADPTARATRFAVPDDCRAQHWLLRATGQRAQTPSAARIANLALAKEG